MIRPLPITGYSLVNALGSGPDEVRAGLAAATTPLATPDIPLPFATAAGMVRTPLHPLTNDLAPWCTPMSRMAGHLVEGLEPALVATRARWRPERIAVVLGTSTAGADVTERAYREFVRTGQLPADYDFRRQHTYGSVLHVVKQLSGARGPAWMLSTACTSSAKPLATARRLIAADLADAVVAGGFDTLCAMTLQGFRSLGALAERPCRPFTTNREGISIGEGGALLLVEREGEPTGLLEGVGESSDAYHMSAPHPQGLGAVAAMERALAEAGCQPGDIDYVNAHGTGTPLNDAAESRAIAQLLGTEVLVSSTKGFTGHTLGGAGATEAALCLLALESGCIPASLGAAPVDPKVEVRVALENTPGTYRRALSNSFAFGGNNVSVLLRAP